MAFGMEVVDNPVRGENLIHVTVGVDARGNKIEMEREKMRSRRSEGIRRRDEIRLRWRDGISEMERWNKIEMERGGG